MNIRKYASICIAQFYAKRLKCAQTWITLLYLQITPCLPVLLMTSQFLHITNYNARYLYELQAINTHTISQDEIKTTGNCCSKTVKAANDLLRKANSSFIFLFWHDWGAGSRKSPSGYAYGIPHPRSQISKLSGT